MGISQQIGASSLIKPGVIDSSAARPASPYEGQVIFQKDTDQLLVWNGTAWVIPNSPAQNPDGLELITTCTVTSAGGTAATASGGVVTIGAGNTSFTVDNAFSANYDNYKIVVAGGTSSTQDSLKFEIGGSAGSYYGTFLYSNYTTNTPNAAGINNGSSFLYAGGTNIHQVIMNLEVQSPFLAKHTYIQALSVIYQNAYGHAVCDHEVASSYTSFKITPASGTITGGTLRVYGYRNS
jgi:hypothetical protein